MAEFIPLSRNFKRGEGYLGTDPYVIDDCFCVRCKTRSQKSLSPARRPATFLGGKGAGNGTFM